MLDKEHTSKASIVVPYKTVVADCPWRFRDALPGSGRGAVKHYKTMTVDELCQLQLPPIDKSAVLLFWRVAAMQQEALTVIRSWGFTPKAELVWVKQTVKGNGLAFGMGHYVRACHETCIVAIRGSIKVAQRNQRSVFFAPRGQHSEKPNAFFEIVERLFPTPRLELFGRQARPGWDVLGDEAPSPTTLEPREQCLTQTS